MAEDKAEKIVKEVAASMKGASWQEIARVAETRIREETGKGMGISGVMNNYGNIILGSNNSSSSTSSSTSSSGSSSKSSTSASSSSKTTSGSSSSSSSSNTTSTSSSSKTSSGSSSSTSTLNTTSTTTSTITGPNTSQAPTKISEVENSTLNYRVVVEKTPDGKYRTVVYGEGGAKELSVRQSLEDAQADAQRYASKPQSAFKDVSEYFSIQHRDAYFVNPETIAKEFKLGQKKETIQAIEKTQNKIAWAYTLADIDARKREEELKKQAEYLEKTLTARSQELAQGTLPLDYVYSEAAAEYAKEKAKETGEIVVFSPETLKQNFGDQVNKYVSDLTATINAQKQSSAKTATSTSSNLPQSNGAVEFLSNFSMAVSQQSAQEKLNRLEEAQKAESLKNASDGKPVGVLTTWTNPQAEWYKLSAFVEDATLKASLKVDNEFGRGVIGATGELVKSVAGIVDFLGQVSGAYGIWNNWFSKDSKNKTYQWDQLSTSDKIKVVLTSPWVDYTKDEGSTKPVTEYFITQFPKDIRKDPLGTMGMLGSAVIQSLVSPFEKLKDRDPYVVGSGIGEIAGNFVGPIIAEEAVTATQKTVRNIGVKLSIPNSVNAEKIFDPDVLAGKKTFPTAPNADVALEKFKSAKTSTGKLATVHATGQDMPSKLIVKPGPAAAKNLEDAGLYVAPYGQGSPYFLKVEEKIKYSLNPLDVFDMFKPKAPTAVVVQADDIARPPSSLITTPGFEELNKWYSQVNKPATPELAQKFVVNIDEPLGPKPGVIYQTKRSIVGHTSEIEAVVPVNTLLIEDVSKRVRTNVKGWEVPVKTYVPVPYTTLQSDAPTSMFSSVKKYAPQMSDDVIYVERTVPIIPVSLLRGADDAVGFNSEKMSNSKTYDSTGSVVSSTSFSFDQISYSSKGPSTQISVAGSSDFVSTKFSINPSYGGSKVRPQVDVSSLQNISKESTSRSAGSSKSTSGKSILERGFIEEKGPGKNVGGSEIPIRDILPDSIGPGRSLGGSDISSGGTSPKSYEPTSFGSLGGVVRRSSYLPAAPSIRKEVPMYFSKKEKSTISNKTVGRLKEKAKLMLAPKAELFYLEREDKIAGFRFSQIGKHPLPSQKQQWVQQFNIKFMGPTRSMILSQKKNKRGVKL